MPARKRRKVRWSEAALGDLIEIARYIAADSPRSAQATLRELRSHAGSLATMPKRGRIVPETSWVGVRALRELIVRPYRLIYRLDGEASVLVVAALDGRRDVEAVLLERLTRDS